MGKKNREIPTVLAGILDYDFIVGLGLLVVVNVTLNYSTGRRGESAGMILWR